MQSMNYVGKVLIFPNVHSPFLHFPPLHSNFCNIRIVLMNFAIMSHQCDLKLTSKVEMDQMKKIKCTSTFKSDLEGEFLLSLACLFMFCT